MYLEIAFCESKQISSHIIQAKKCLRMMLSSLRRVVNRGLTFRLLREELQKFPRAKIQLLDGFSINCQDETLLFVPCLTQHPREKVFNSFQGKINLPSKFKPRPVASLPPRGRRPIQCSGGCSSQGSRDEDFLPLSLLFLGPSSSPLQPPIKGRRRLSLKLAF